MKHELWLEADGRPMFCLAGPHGDGARALLMSDAKLMWTVDASSHYEAMCKYYAHMDWGEYTTNFPEHDKKTYREMGWE